MKKIRRIDDYAVIAIEYSYTTIKGEILNLVALYSVDNHDDNAEEEVKKETEYITLGTSTHDYKKIFHFYIEEVGMSFHSALFLKKI